MRGIDGILLGSTAVVAVIGVIAAGIMLPRMAQKQQEAVARRSAMIGASACLGQLIPLAQTLYKHDGQRDRDDDGIGEYGTIADLLASGMLPDDDWRVQDGVHVRDAYRFEVRLSGEADLDEVGYVVVAQPLRPDLGLRPLLVSESGQLLMGPADWLSHQRIEAAAWQPWTRDRLPPP